MKDGVQKRKLVANRRNVIVALKCKSTYFQILKQLFCLFISVILWCQTELNTQIKKLNIFTALKGTNEESEGEDDVGYDGKK